MQKHHSYLPTPVPLITCCKPTPAEKTDAPIPYDHGANSRPYPKQASNLWFLIRYTMPMFALTRPTPQPRFSKGGALLVFNPSLEQVALLMALLICPFLAFRFKCRMLREHRDALAANIHTLRAHHTSIKIHLFLRPSFVDRLCGILSHPLPCRRRTNILEKKCVASHRAAIHAPEFQIHRQL